MTVKPRRRIPRVSAKRLAASGPQYSTITTQGKKPKPVNRKRKAKAHARAYGDRVEWIQAQPCCVCGWSVSEAAHTSGDGGAGLKSSSRYLVPLCGPHWSGSTLVEGCHRESGRVGVRTFQASHNVNFSCLAGMYNVLWQDYRCGITYSGDES